MWPSYYHNTRARSSAPADELLSEPETSGDEDDDDEELFVVPLFGGHRFAAIADGRPDGHDGFDE